MKSEKEFLHSVLPVFVFKNLQSQDTDHEGYVRIRLVKSRSDRIRLGRSGSDRIRIRNPVVFVWWSLIWTLFRIQYKAFRLCMVPVYLLDNFNAMILMVAVFYEVIAGLRIRSDPDLFCRIRKIVTGSGSYRYFGNVKLHKQGENVLKIRLKHIFRWICPHFQIKIIIIQISEEICLMCKKMLMFELIL